MRAIGKYEVIARIAGPGLVLGAVFALVLSSSSVGRAQASTTSPAVPAATPAQAAPTAQAEQPATPAKRQPGGTDEGIKVHGHWMIEVRSPDGKLVSHTEFENSVIPSTQEPMIILVGAYTAGEWGIVMGGNSSPCTANVVGPFGVFDTEGIYNITFAPPYCVISGTAPFITPTGCTAAAGGIPASSCSQSLGVVPNSGGDFFTLSGQVVATESGTISRVGTILGVCPNGVSPNTCATETARDSAQDFVSGFTAATLPQSGSGTPCGGTGEISCAVTVPAAGDTINVQVTISFQ